MVFRSTINVHGECSMVWRRAYSAPLTALWGLSADVVEPAFAVNDVVDAECQQVEPFGLHAVYERNDAVGFERVVGVDHHRVSAA